jgi:thiol-disulfide isomerase/thioredoxin
MTRYALPFALLIAGCAQKSQVDSLEARVKALEERSASAPAKPGAAAASTPEDDAAKKLMEEAQNALAADDYPTATAKLQEVVDKYGTSRVAAAAKKQLPEVQLVGSDAKPLEVEKWYQGKASLTDSKATLLVFWESWCPHCKREMPKMPALAEKWKPKGLQVVGITKVTKSATDETVTAFLKENNINIPIAKEKDGSLSAAYAVTGIPAAAIVKDGKVVWRGHPARLTDEAIEKILAG